MEDLLSKLELGCLNDSAEKFFATQCNSKEAVCLLLADGIVNHGSTTLQYISGKEAACRQADFKVWFEAPLGMPGLSWSRGVYSSLFGYIHTYKKLPFLADFIKKLGPFYKKLRCDKFGNLSISTKTALNNQIQSSMKIYMYIVC